MVKACIFGDLTTRNMKANSKKIHYKAKPEFTSLPINITMEGSEMEKEMGKETMFMKMEILSQVNGKTISNWLVITNSKMGTNSKASSKIISLTLEFWDIIMERHMKESLKMAAGMV